MTEQWRYEKLTWPEINHAITAQKIAICPVGSTVQHGPHLPLDVDVVCPQGVAHAAARLIPDEVVVLPPFVHGYTAHVMDFPGTVNIHWQHFIDCIIDIGKSLAYHGFKKIIFLNGHGSNAPNLDLAARRVNLETDGECIDLAFNKKRADDRKGWINAYQEIHATMRERSVSARKLARVPISCPFLISDAPHI